MNLGRPVTLVAVDRGGYREIGLITCEVCAAALIVDKLDHSDAITRHNDWHARQDEKIREAAAAYRQRLG